MPTAFPAPVKVSPFIKFARWSLLLAGIAYGAMWQKRYTSKELALKDVRAKEKAIRDAKLAQEKAIRNAAEMEELERMGRGGK